MRLNRYGALTHLLAVQKVLAPRGGHLLAALFLFDASLPVRGPCARAAAAVSAPVPPLLQPAWLDDLHPPWTSVCFTEYLNCSVTVRIQSPCGTDAG